MASRLANDKHCVITGAGQGIGRSITEAFLREGANVLALDLRCETLRECQRKSLDVIEVDVTNFAAISAIAAAHRQINVVVNCVGVVVAGTILDISVDELEMAFRANVISMYNTIRAFLPSMLERRAGAIVNIASVVSSVKAVPRRFAYGTTKAAVIGLTKAVARDFITEGVRCNSISPGTVLSPSLQLRLAAQGDKEAALAEYVARQPMGRLGSPEEIAEVAVLLASDEARFMTGENITIDGGMSL